MYGIFTYIWLIFMVNVVNIPVTWMVWVQRRGETVPKEDALLQTKGNAPLFMRSDASNKRTSNNNNNNNQ